MQQDRCTSPFKLTDASLKTRLLVNSFERKSSLLATTWLLCGADVGAVDSAGQPLLQLAIANGWPSVVRLLVERGAPVANQLLHLLAGQLETDWSPVCRFLVDSNRTDVNEVDGQGRTPLHLAVTVANFWLLDCLLEAGGERLDLEAADRWQSTALHLAVARNSLRAVRALLAKGANANSFNQEHRTPLHLAVIANSPRVAEQLMFYGARAHWNRVQDVSGKTPAFYALTLHYGQAIEKLIDSKLVHGLELGEMEFRGRKRSRRQK